MRPEHRDPLAPEELRETHAVIVKVERIVAGAQHDRLLGRPNDQALLRLLCGRLGAILGALQAPSRPAARSLPGVRLT